MRKQLTDDQMYRRVRVNTIAIMGFFALLGLMTERIVLTIAAVVAAIALSFWQRTPRYRAKFDRAMAKRRARYAFSLCSRSQASSGSFAYVGDKPTTSVDRTGLKGSSSALPVAPPGSRGAVLRAPIS
jgi:hypothetical protein